MQVFLTLHLMITYSEGLSIFFSEYYYIYLIFVSVPLIVLCIIYFWFYFKFPKFQWLISICFLVFPILILSLMGIKNRSEQLNKYLWKEESIINNLKDDYLPMMLNGLILSIVMGLLLNFLMKKLFKDKLEML